MSNLREHLRLSQLALENILYDSTLRNNSPVRTQFELISKFLVRGELPPGYEDIDEIEAYIKSNIGRKAINMAGEKPPFE